MRFSFLILLVIILLSLLTRAHRPVVPMKSISFRSTSAIVFDRFESDITKISFFVSPSDFLDDHLNQYNTGTRDVLDQHAPFKHRTFTVRPVNPWFSCEISQARRQMRKFERVWRRRRLEIDKEILLHHRNQLARLVIDSKLAYFRTKITECGSDRKVLYRLLDRCLITKKVTRLPRHSSPLVLANEFSCFFQDKIKNIRSVMDTSANSVPVPPDSACSHYLSSFLPFTPSEATELVKKCTSKSCSLDPIPTHILKPVVHVVSSSFARLINLSFAAGTFPDPLKLAIITPILKKNNLDPENLANFNPVSGLPFMSKLIEKTVLTHLSTHLETPHLLVPFQFAYRSNHSTETALLRVFNDLVMTVDSGRAAVLTLLDLSAAFDTVDHPTLLSRLELGLVYLGRRSSGSVRILRTDLRWFPSLVLLRPLLLFVLVSLMALF